MKPAMTKFGCPLVSPEDSFLYPLSIQTSGRVRGRRVRRVHSSRTETDRGTCPECELQHCTQSLHSFAQRSSTCTCSRSPNWWEVHWQQVPIPSLDVEVEPYSNNKIVTSMSLSKCPVFPTSVRQLLSTTPHFVPDPDNVVLNVRDWDRGVRGNGYSSLVLEMPLALSHGRVEECTAQEQHRATESCSCIAKYCKRQLQIPSPLRTNEKFLGNTGSCCQRKLPSEAESNRLLIIHPEDNF